MNNAAVESIIKKAELFNPDLVYTNSSVINIGSIMAGILNKPHIWHLREFRKADYDLEFFLSKKKVRQEFNKSSAIIGISSAIRNHYQPMVNIDIPIIYNGVIWN